MIFSQMMARNPLRPNQNLILFIIPELPFHGKWCSWPLGQG